MVKLRDGMQVQDFDVSEIPVKSFFRGIHGFGAGKGAPASLAKARELLLNEKIVEVIGEPTGQPERVILRQLVLEDGTKLHFDSSSKGACLYYIEEPGPSCVEVVEHEISTSATASSDQNREETGRASEVDGGGSNEARRGPSPTDAAATEQPKPGGVSSVSEIDRVPNLHSPGDRASDDDPRMRM
jgi:hypothetical protein